MRAILSKAAGFGLTLGVATAPLLSAQAPTARECERAAGVVARGRITSNDYPAVLTLTECGSVATNAYATGIAKLSTETDTARLEDYWAAVDNWRDASILTAVTQLANKTSATPQARVYAVRHLITLLQPAHQFTYAGLAMGADSTTSADGTRQWSGGCRGTMLSHGHGSIQLSPLPADYATQIRATLAALAASQSAPPPVNNAARCVLPP